MMKFEERRRQNYIDEESYRNTLAHLSEDDGIYKEKLLQPSAKPGENATTLDFKATGMWEAFQLRYTGGEKIADLAQSFGEVVMAYDDYVRENAKRSEEDYVTPFRMRDMIDNYVDYLHLLSVAVLLHREDLIPTIHRMIEGTEFDGTDAVIEELLTFYLPKRPALDSWLWNKPYRLLLDALDADDAAERPALMKKYVSSWYPSMKGRAHF